jgi:hypothetical protein
MKHKVKELEGALLDAAVAKANGRPPPGTWVRDSTPGLYESIDTSYIEPKPPAFSTDWQDGGPIIERKRIGTMPIADGWAATVGGGVPVDGPNIDPDATGPTPLIAAMRAYVVGGLGDEVDLP